MLRPIILLIADARVPMIFLTFPAMLALLIPIIFLEAWLCRRWLGLDTWTAIKSNALANVASTLIGVPAAWCVMLSVEMFVGVSIIQLPGVERIWNSLVARVVSALLFSAWLGPDEKNLYWMIPVAVLGLLIPTYLLSVWIESFIIDHMVSMPDEDPSNLTSFRVRQVVRHANLASYALLAGGAVAWLFVSLLKPPR